MWEDVKSVATANQLIPTKSLRIKTTWNKLYARDIRSCVLSAMGNTVQ